ncbi:MAG TPA: DedA family protein [Candidatus Bathyarchaeia archaeon]|nr:DedA family protein [Candidatus Bathyarchaeia archaeon]
MVNEVVQWIVATVGQWGYAGIVIMMLLESSFFPFPSEVVMIPAGYLAQKGEMNLFLAIAMGILGSWLGALLNYYLAVFLGRPFFLKYGKYLLISEVKFLRGEGFFRRHGEIGTFTGRLIPVVRQYISFPAGLARMNLAHFLFFTGLGAGIWVTILACIGYVAGQNEQLIRDHLHNATIWVVMASLAIIAIYVYFYRRKTRRGRKSDPAP